MERKRAKEILKMEDACAEYIKKIREKSFGEKLKILREYHRMTQAQFAEAIDIGQKTISNWEKNICLPRQCHRDILLEIYGQTYYYLVWNEITKKSCMLIN